MQQWDVMLKNEADEISHVIVSADTPEKASELAASHGRVIMLEAVKTTPVILVGRHPDFEIPGVEVVRQENILFSTNYAECEKQVGELLQAASGAKLSVLFQNTPGIVTAVLVKFTCTLADEWQPLSGRASKVGVIISKPGPRIAGVRTEVTFCADQSYGMDFSNEIVKLVSAANGRAKVEVSATEVSPSGLVTQTAVVTVDPVSPFEFDHIEWL